MRTLKFKAQPTNTFFAAVSQTFGGSYQLTTTAEHCFVVWAVLNDLITARSAVVGSWEEPPSIWLTVARNAFAGWALNFRVRMLLKGAVIKQRLNGVCLLRSLFLPSTFNHSVFSWFDDILNIKRSRENSLWSRDIFRNYYHLYFNHFVCEVVRKGISNAMEIMLGMLQCTADRILIRHLITGHIYIFK